jgi:large-conductance mechanosensitive channel
VLWFDLPDPSPVPTSGVDADLVTPGVWGFVITFLLVVAVVLLIIDMTRRIRRVTYRAQVKEQLEAEQLAAEAAALKDDKKK